MLILSFRCIEWFRVRFVASLSLKLIPFCSRLLTRGLTPKDMQVQVGDAQLITSAHNYFGNNNKSPSNMSRTCFFSQGTYRSRFDIFHHPTFKSTTSKSHIHRKQQTTFKSPLQVVSLTAPNTILMNIRIWVKPQLHHAPGRDLCNNWNRTMFEYLPYVL
ncbi:hypothetical protein FF38_09702 [Lucilia cuprina]|uniref:Uncharacterized protein n=1 Tax=Lucilia cuprina TaxID=7375 RepID=A0A0L0C543_LUCCU|nr:hypothetical protein FF38_09702 [Lucilia cuprina]